MKPHQRQIIHSAVALSRRIDKVLAFSGFTPKTETTVELARRDEERRGPGLGAVAGAVGAGYGALSYARGARTMRQEYGSGPDNFWQAQTAVHIGHRKNMANVSAFFRRPKPFVSGSDYGPPGPPGSAVPRPSIPQPAVNRAAGVAAAQKYLATRAGRSAAGGLSLLRRLRGFENPAVRRAVLELAAKHRPAATPKAS